MATQGGPAKAVVVQTGGQAIGGPALPVAVVTDGRAVEGGPSMPIVIVTSGPVQGGPALPVVAATGAQASQVMAGKAIPVYVVSGAFAPTNTALPAISGSGAVLSSTTGTWTGSPVSYAYQWNRNGVAIGGATSSTYTIGPSDIGATLTVTVTATNASGGSTSATSANYTLTYTQKVLATALANLIGYWPQAESSGAVATDESGNGRNGTYTAVTLGQTGIGDGRTAAEYDGTTSYANVLTAGLTAALNTSEGTACVWVYKPAAWNDANFREILNLTTGGGSEIRITKSNTGDLQGVYNVGGVFKLVTMATGASLNAAQWYFTAVTWSKAADQFIGYVNTTATAPATGLGVPAGALNKAVIGSKNLPGFVWLGREAHAAIWTTPLSAAQLALLATV